MHLISLHLREGSRFDLIILHRGRRRERNSFFRPLKQETFLGSILGPEMILVQSPKIWLVRGLVKFVPAH